MSTVAEKSTVLNVVWRGGSVSGPTGVRSTGGGGGGGGGGGRGVGGGKGQCGQTWAVGGRAPRGGSPYRLMSVQIRITPQRNSGLRNSAGASEAVRYTSIPYMPVIWKSGPTEKEAGNPSR